MDAIPADLQPAVREYLALVRLQALTPLSLLINIATVVTCAFIPNTSLGQVIKTHPTSISPKAVIIAGYVLATFAGQLGYCVLLVLAKKTETKKTLTSHGIGMSLVLANFAQALWAIFWVLEWFKSATALQGLLLILLLYANLMLIWKHAPTSERPLDTMFIHAPLRFFLILELALMFPLSLFVMLGLEYVPTDPDQPVDYSTTSWPGFGVVLGTNLLGLAVIIARRDIVWAFAATWISVSIWSFQPKPAAVFITAMVFTILHPLALLTVYIYSGVVKSRRVVRLPGDEHPGLYIQNRAPELETQNQGPREINEETWG
ncbi:hypothetical protein C8J56DRAFT_926263 [Mycena floridula]|nr:hypothetical protein C8J56DRAFT_926263 [Mycena floridula]